MKLPSIEKNPQNIQQDEPHVHTFLQGKNSMNWDVWTSWSVANEQHNRYTHGMTREGFDLTRDKYDLKLILFPQAATEFSGSMSFNSFKNWLHNTWSPITNMV